MSAVRWYLVGPVYDVRTKAHYQRIDATRLGGRLSSHVGEEIDRVRAVSLIGETNAAELEALALAPETVASHGWRA